VSATVRAVLFDFSATLFHLDEPRRLLDPVLDGVRPPLTAAERATLIGRVTAALATPPADREVSAELRAAYRDRHLDPALHRRVYTWLIRRAGLPYRELAERMYDRIVDPAAWRPYPDTVAALGAVRAAGLSVAVISNIAHDIRPTFVAHGVDGLVDEMVLSFEQGLVKPDPAIFRVACDRLGVDPADTAVVGDNPDEDGGIRSLGSRFGEVARQPPEHRPDGLLAALDRIEVPRMAMLAAKVPDA